MVKIHLKEISSETVSFIKAHIHVGLLHLCQQTCAFSPNYDESQFIDELTGS